MKQETEILYLGNSYCKEMMEPEVLPIYNTTAYVMSDLDEYDEASKGKKYYYGRTANPNRDALAESMSFLEKGEKSLIFSSGMGAISTTLIALLKMGDHILLNYSIYGETIELVEQVLKKNGIQYSYADFTNLDDVKAKIQNNTKIFYTEVIANPLITIVDIELISHIAREAGALTVVDSTFTTPYAIQPIKFGADLVIQSLTKFINGHSDITGGSVTGSKKLIDIIEPIYLLLGAIIDANSSYLTLRSIRTFPLRMEQHMQNAKKLAEFLDKHPSVRTVNYPSLTTHPQHELAERILNGRYGAMLSFRVEDDREKVNSFIRKLKLVKYLGTLGGYRTSFAHPATAFRNEFTTEQLEAMGMYEGLLRLSVGLENINDIIDDIKQALDVF